MLAASIASASAAAEGPTSRVNSFVGNFDLVDWDLQTPVARVVANVREATDARLVPGSVDIYWAEGSPFWAWSDSPYYTDGRVPRQSHAQLFKAQFTESTYDGAAATEVFVSGYICHYWGPPPGDWGVFDAACQPFVIDFQDISDPFTPHRVGFSLPGDWGCCGGPWFPAAKDGAFVLTYAGPTFDQHASHLTSGQLPAGRHAQRAFAELRPIRTAPRPLRRTPRCGGPRRPPWWRGT